MVGLWPCSKNMFNIACYLFCILYTYQVPKKLKINEINEIYQSQFFCLNPFLGNTFTSGAHAVSGLR